MKILVMGGTRFVGKPLVRLLNEAGHELTLFTRGRNPVPAGLEHFTGDRSNSADLDQLAGRSFEVIIDSSGRNLADSRAVVERTGAPSHRFVYVSSAGVYADSELWPLDENAPTDPASRHAGKAETEAWLRAEGIPFTSFRPTYIYGPGNYNPVERWFFDRIVHGLPVPLPGDGRTITQLGHVEDLATALARSIEVETAANRIYNCSGAQGVTFRGLVAAAAHACGKDPEAVELRYFDPAGLDPKARKAFPLRLSHFLTDVHRLERELAWSPRFDLERGLADSYANDYSLRSGELPDCSGDAALR
ncbi:NAD-dependent epimerase/dehydratase family protein [Cyanobium sp. Morenito 9A2]|uniref:NAD-dependent epimerase/dehydratase family protein n=1 Tax=Cyanobium sp. Morenito 9A2 TaxID=2823718 RepID=UPI0020CEE5F4|nr:NAD-dependent epimerase/dehydratase family protein [Cyanobium sp. Morenito 9A2]MCP9850160.1 NAD-dependent epimerase/dehydratase family protein [Cyanobium sp. Morenito 9A2]